MQINGTMTVQDLLLKHPEAFDVLQGHGMCASCKKDPPPVPLQHFATKHCNGDLPSLVKEIEAAIAESRPRNG